MVEQAPEHVQNIANQPVNSDKLIKPIHSFRSLTSYLQKFPPDKDKAASDQHAKVAHLDDEANLNQDHIEGPPRLVEEEKEDDGSILRQDSQVAESLKNPSSCIDSNNNESDNHAQRIESFSGKSSDHSSKKWFAFQNIIGSE